MINNIESKTVVSDLKKVIVSNSAELFLVNILSTDVDLINKVVAEVGSNSVAIECNTDCISLPKVYEEFEATIRGLSKVILMNVSHNKGWTQIEYCLVDPLNAGKRGLDAKEAVLIGDAKVFNGEPYYDEDIL
ncbi:hypothetical protein [Pseudoalteromonas prydzensis]|uniref:hypothetical protein n=1 Tax=Pseudoalteromonas prydzensis TaxID=182141 RepID=UPI003FD2A2D6